MMQLLRYDEFKTELLNGIKNCIPDAYKKYSIEIHKIKKSNQSLDGICMLDKTKHTAVSPVIYAEGLYNSYIGGTNMENIIKTASDLLFGSFVKIGDKMSSKIAFLVKLGSVIFDFLPHAKKYGFTTLMPIRDRVRCACYIAKYITKDMFNNTPPPRTHLYFASRGLKFDEVISVGHAPTALVPPAESEQFSCRFCHKYVSDTNIFWTEPFTSLDVAPELPSAVDLNQYKIAALYKFCNNNGLYLNEQIDLLRKYETLKNAIFDDYHNGYDCLKSHFAALRKEFKALDNMTDDQIEAIFASAAVDDLVADSGNVLQTVLAAAPIPLHPPKDVIQLSMFEGDHYAVE